jgi:DNA polymerase III subunit epsilon
MRQIVLDTETTGLEPSDGHRVIEIGCVELVNRRPTGRSFHEYLNPQREVEAGAIEVHGLDNAFLADKPAFEQIAEAFLEFIRVAELVIHNAPFDVGFLDNELRLMGHGEAIADCCEVLDTLELARKLHPGQRNSLDALCKRYEVDNSNRELHGALLDAEILADVYLAMTGGQTALSLGQEQGQAGARVDGEFEIRRLERDGLALEVVRASEEEVEAHHRRLRQIDQASGGALWRQGAGRPAEGE